MAELHQFTYGWITPAFAAALALLGALVGLGCAARARAGTGWFRRLLWLALAAWSLGGIALWSMHFVALIGFTAGGTAVFYEPADAARGLGFAMAAVAVGVALVGFGRPGRWRVLLAGGVLGAALAFAHYADLRAMRLDGGVTLDRVAVVASFAVPVVVAATALWWAVLVGGRLGTIAGAAVLGVAACCAHFLGMAAVRVHLNPATAGVSEPSGLSVNLYLAPVVLFATTVVVALTSLLIAGPGRPRVAAAHRSAPLARGAPQPLSASTSRRIEPATFQRSASA